MPDIRDRRPAAIPDECGRTPDVADVAEAVRHAQAALREIEDRRRYEQERTTEESLSRQLADWAGDTSVAETGDAHVVS